MVVSCHMQSGVVRSTLLQGWVGAALKGESGGVTRICVEKSRFVDFLTSLESEQKLPPWSPTIKRSLIPYLSLFLLKIDDLCCAWHFSDVICYEHLRIFMKSKEWYRGSSLIALSVHFNVYTHFQNDILRRTFSYVFLDICVLQTSESSWET